MAIICTTPVLGFSATLQDENYPYLISAEGVSPQIGSVVDTIDTETNTAARYELVDQGAGVYGWSAVVP